MRSASYLIAVVLGLALTFGATPAQAETTNCTPITLVPTIITVQGIYCFTQHLDTSITTGFAIEIQTNNVTLDLNGFKLGGLAAGSGTQAYGIFAENRQNITIKNGTVRGFLVGIQLAGITDQGHIVEDIRADHNILTGIGVSGLGVFIRNNQVVATGGSPQPDASAFGIFASGTGPSVLNNTVIDVRKQGAGTATGIFVNAATGALAVNNRITNADAGIVYSGGSTGLAVNNRMTDAVKGIEFVDGSKGKYRDNLTFDVTTPFFGGTSVGIND